HEEINLSYTGEYIVAVDYVATQQGDQEILAKVVATGGGRSVSDTTIVWDIQQCKDPDINGSDDIGTTSGSAVSSENVDRKTELIFGRQRLTIYRQTDTASGQLSDRTIQGVAFLFDFPETAEFAADLSRARLGALYFLDLRYELYVVDEYREADKVTRTQQQGTACTESTNNATETVKIFYNETIPVGERPVLNPSKFCVPGDQFPGI